MQLGKYIMTWVFRSPAWHILHFNTSKIAFLNAPRRVEQKTFAVINRGK